MKSDDWNIAREQRKLKWVARLNYLANRVHAVAWVLAAIFAVYYCNFFLNLWENPRINNLFFSIALVTFGVFFSIMIYASFVLKNIEDIEITAPRLIPVATIFGFVCFNSTLIAIWPVWGWYSPLILLTMFMGYMTAGSFMPKGNLGSIAYLVFIIGSGFSSRFIPHEGLLN